MRLFVTVGLESFPFSRLVDAVDAAVEDGLLDPETFIQYGTACTRLRAASGSPYLERAEVVERIASCDAVVAHAGVGTVMACRDSGKTPVLVPRLHALGEHVDDHQCEFAEALASEGLALVAGGTATTLRGEILDLARRSIELGAGAGSDSCGRPGAALAAYLGSIIDPLDTRGR